MDLPVSFSSRTSSQPARFRSPSINFISPSVPCSSGPSATYSMSRSLENLASSGLSVAQAVITSMALRRLSFLPTPGACHEGDPERAVKAAPGALPARGDVDVHIAGFVSRAGREIRAGAEGVRRIAKKCRSDR